MTTCAVYVWLLRGYLSIFFQAEDGIRDRNVTGVQTCALPIAAMGGAGAAPAVEAEHGMVVSAHRLASEAGVRIFQEGGNAIDAAVAVGYALAVVDPCCGNLGGGGFMTLHLADGHESVINFRET